MTCRHECDCLCWSARTWKRREHQCVRAVGPADVALASPLGEAVRSLLLLVTLFQGSTTRMDVKYESGEEVRLWDRVQWGSGPGFVVFSIDADRVQPALSQGELVKPRNRDHGGGPRGR